MIGQRFRAWLQLALPSLGGFGLLVAAFVDSSFIPLPLVTDLLLMELSSRHPVRMLYYAGMATVGSLAGCIWIYWLARKGGETHYSKKEEPSPSRIHKFIQKYPLACTFFPAVAPFPVPFKPFVIAQGVFQVPFAIFVMGTFLGRGALFLFEGFLGARYGEQARQFVITQKWPSIALVVGLVLLFLLIRRVHWFRHTKHPQAS